MATAHPRIGLTRDPELAAALEVTRELLGDDAVRSEAGHVRELALLGAQALTQRTPLARAVVDRGRLLRRSGVRPATQDLADLPWLDEESVDDERRTSRDLEWARGER